MVVFMVSDLAAFMFTSGGVSIPGAGILLVKTIYFMSTTLMCCSWYFYFECMRNPEFWKNRRNLFILSVPLGVQFVMEMINWKSGIFFFVSDGNYQRGPLFALQYVFAYGYVVVAIARALVAGIKETNYVDRDRIITIALFPVFPAAAGILQYYFPNLPLACAAITISMLLLFFNRMESVISTDPLTNLNNRRVLMYNLSRRMKERTDEGELYLLMIDANWFKEINDNYGHLEGDKALIRIAEALKQACELLKKRPTIARFGGDEFVVAAELESDEELQGLCDRIHENLKRLNQEQKVSYKLTVSVGAAVWKPEMRTVRDFLDRADEKLYEVKRRR